MDDITTLLDSYRANGPFEFSWALVKLAASCDPEIIARQLSPDELRTISGHIDPLPDSWMGNLALTCIPFGQVIHCLALHPVADQRAMLMFFLPAVLASLFVLADNGRFNRTVVKGARLLLSVNAITAVVVDANLLTLKPQFAGILPPQVDRALVLYLIGWYTFILIVCPCWYLHWRFAGEGRLYGRLSIKSRIGWLTWAFVLSAFMVAAGRKLF